MKTIKAPHNRDDTGSFWVLALYQSGHGSPNISELTFIPEGRVLRIVRQALPPENKPVGKRYCRDAEWHQLSAFVVDQFGFESGDPLTHWCNHPEVHLWFRRQYDREWHRSAHKSPDYYAKRKSQPNWLRNTRAYGRRKIENLTDNYIRNIITAKSSLKYSDIPKEMVDAHRELLRLKREAKQL